MKRWFDCRYLYLRAMLGALALGFGLLPASAYAAPATVTGVTATTGSYGLGLSIPITVTFSAPVTVVGSPTLALNASVSASATCTAITSSTTMTCSYTVVSGNAASPLEYTATTALALNGGTITTDSDSSAATLTLATPGAAGSLTASAVVVETTAPTLPAANIVANNSVRPNTETLTFSEAMANNAALTTASNYTVTNSNGTITYTIATAVRTSATVVTLTLAAADPSDTKTFFTNTDLTAHLVVTPATALTDLAGNHIANTPVLSTAASTQDATVPTLPAANIVANNSVQPNTVALTFSEPLINNANITNVAKYTLTNNSAGITYALASAAQTAPGVVTLTLATPLPATPATYITSTDIAGHLKVALAAGFADLAGNALAAATITEASAVPTLDTTAPTVVTTLAYVDSTHVTVTFSEKVNKTAAETLTNYTISGTGGMVSLSGAPTAAVLASSGVDVTLTVPSLSAIKAGDTVKITAGVGITDISGKAMAAAGTATLTAANTPAAFSFTSVTNSSVKTAVASNAITISGVNVPATLSVVAGSDSSLQCAIAPLATGVFGAFGSCAPSTPLTLGNGDQLKLQLTSSALGTTTTSGSVSIGGVSGTFSVTTAATVPVPGVTFTALTALTSLFSSVDPAISLSANGVVQIPSTVTSTMTVVPAAPASTAIILKSGGTYNFALGPLAQTVKPVGGDVLVTTKSYAVDGATGINVLELASGRAVIAYSGPEQPLASVQAGAGSTAKQMLISAVGTAALSLDVQHVSDGTAIIGVTTGRINLRQPSATSTVALADLPTRIYSSEVATITAAGKVGSIRLGSIAGTDTTIVGDALPATIYPAGVSSRVKQPNLGIASERADASKPLMQSLFDFTGSRTTLKSTTQGTNGQIPMLWNGVPLYITPYGDVLVDSTRVDGITLTSDGHFEVSRNGVIAKLTTTASNMGLFAQAVQSAYSGGAVTITEDGAFEISNNGKTLLMKPDLVSQSGGLTGIGLVQDSNGQWVYQTLGQTQALYPHIYDLTQLATTLSVMDPKVTLRDNLNGTVTATIGGNPYVLVPEYEVLSAIGGIPPEHRADAWWASSDGIIYFKYTSGSAQGFRVQ